MYNIDITKEEGETMKAYERFLNYVKVHTASDEQSGTHPSSKRQFSLANMLRDELINIGCKNVRLSDKCYVYAEIPATEGFENSASLGFIAHMDTSPDYNGEGVKPQIVKNYDGKDIPLGTSGKTLDIKTFPHLAYLKGRTLITTDGTTLLGADDKAGIAEIMTAAEEIIKENTPHGKICIAFTPDEEIGEGSDFFDVESFGADFAYTLDGDIEGGLEYENFNAAGAQFEIFGTNVHPGSAKDVMVNASLVAMQINSMLPADEVPAKTEGYEGFFHLTDMEGSVEKAKLCYIVRDHNASSFDCRINTLKHIEKVIKEKYGEKSVVLTVKEQYRNMYEQIAPHKHLIENARKAAENCGAPCKVSAIRGGTDGARLSFMGLPCPNLGTGGFAFHGPYEHVSIEGMETATNIIKELVKLYSEVKL